MPELTPHEKELLADPDGFVRGYTPRDGRTEPAEPPEGPAAASPPNPDKDTSGSAESAGLAHGPT